MMDEVLEVFSPKEVRWFCFLTASVMSAIALWFREGSAYFIVWATFFALLGSHTGLDEPCVP